MRVYQANVYRLVHWHMRALDLLSERRKRRGRIDDCECDLDYQCPQTERDTEIAIRYATWREKRGQK